MKSFRRRRILASLALTLGVCAYAGLHLSWETLFLPAARWSGVLLFAAVGALALFNGRKKLPFLPLLPARIWLQFHIYGGFFTVAVYLLHTGFRPPNGGLEILTALLFATVALSGVLGLILSRAIPRRLTAHGEVAVFERIPGLRRSLRRELEQLILDAEAASHSTTIADFHEARLAAYFARPRHLWSHLVSSSRPLNQMLERIDALGRYLDEKEKQTADRIVELVRAKDNLDRQWHLQGALKLWLFVHIPLSFSLILFAGIHGWIAWRFAG